MWILLYTLCIKGGFYERTVTAGERKCNISFHTEEILFVRQVGFDYFF